MTLQDKALIEGAAREIAAFVGVRHDEWFDDNRTVFYWEQTNPKYNSAVSVWFPVPRWKVIRDAVEKHVIKKCPNTVRIGITTQEILEGSRQGSHRYFLDDWITRLYIAFYYEVFSASETEGIVTEQLLNVLTKKKVKCELLVPIFGFWKLEESILLEKEISLIPASLGMTKYITAIRTEQRVSEYYPTFIPFTDHTPLIQFNLDAQYPFNPLPTDSEQTRIIVERIHAAMILSYPRRVRFPVICTSPKSICSGGGILKQIAMPEPSENYKVSLREMKPLAATWNLVKNIPLDWFETPNDRIALAYQRYRASIGENDAEACLALIIALETILNIAGAKDELKFRYSLMASAALTSHPHSRQKIFKDFKTAYDLRSKTVHTGCQDKAENELMFRLTRYVALLLQQGLIEIKANRKVEKWVSSILDHVISGEPLPSKYRVRFGEMEDAAGI